MTTYELIAECIALGAIAVPIATWVVLRLVRRDRIFADLSPGEIPANPEEAHTRFVSRGAQYWGEVEARSTPPVGVSPGLAGVVLDGAADGRDIAAMILDLARRGWLQLNQVNGTGSAAVDWAITRVDQPLDASLDLNEVHLITNIAIPGETAWLSELCGASDNRLALVQEDLHREVVARGWYPAPPHQTSDIPMAVLGLGGLVGLVLALIDVSGVSIGAGAVIIACSFLTSVIVRGGTPRTALGTAVRIQALGLRRYLDEAQSYQFAYTDALETFRTYLPWAVVFELENQWADTFATLDVVAQTSELQFARDLGWFANIRDRQRAVPPTVPVGDVTAPRRGAYSEEDVVATVLMSPDEVAAEKLSVAAKVTIPKRSRERKGDVRAAAASGFVSGIGPALRRTAGAVVGLVRRPRADGGEDSQLTVPLSPVTAGASGVEEKVPSVRQWVPKELSRSAALQTRPNPATEGVSVPSAPAGIVTPVRAPIVDEAPPRPEARSEAMMFSTWMSEFDLAMTGDVEDKDLEATDGGTVISGPGRFDVLIRPPLWPDVPLGEDEDPRRVG